MQQSNVAVAPRLHVAIVTKSVVLALLAGEQTVESRLSKRVHPARRVAPGDGLIFKCGDGRAYSVVRRVDVLTSLEPLPIGELIATYSGRVDGREVDLAYWQGRQDVKHAVFLHLDEIVPLAIGSHLLPTSRGAWVADYRPSTTVARLLAEALASHRC